MSTDASLDFHGAVTVGERGQIVIPAEVRRAFGIEAGEKLLILCHPADQSIIIVKAEAMMRFLNKMQEVIQVASLEAPQEEGEEG
jgi:AbrB family looped-hinge helix DNA binding protein